MAKVQIDEDVFLMLYKMFCMDIEPTTEQHNSIKFELDDKMNRILSRTYYSNYMNADKTDKNEKLKLYIEHKKGI